VRPVDKGEAGRSVVLRGKVGYRYTAGYVDNYRGIMGKNISKLFKDHGDSRSSKLPVTFQSNLVRNVSYEEYDAKYKEGTLLGTGITGCVHEVEDIATGKKFAMKTINLEKIDKAQIKELKTEIEILRQLDHPNIVRLHQVYQDDKSNTIKLVMELLTGGSLSKRKFESEDEVRRIIFQVLSACRYFHSRGVVHRDIKMDNIMFSNESKDSDVKIIDFGLGGHFLSQEMVQQERERTSRGSRVSTPSRGHKADSKVNCHSKTRSGSISDVVSPIRRLSGNASRNVSDKSLAKSRIFKTSCGTAYYMSPELCSGTKYLGDKVDMWAIGVVTYLMFANHQPFAARTEKEVFELIRRARPTFSEPIWRSVSPAAIQFIRNCLSKNAETRYSAERALSSSWMRSQTELATSADLEKRVIDSLMRFQTYSALKQAALMIIAHNRSNFQSKPFNHLFLAIDANNQGHIVYEELRDFIQTRNNSVSEGKVQELFEALDQDRSGVIRYMEFLAASIETEGPITRKMCMEAFNHLDAHNTGFITRKSLQKLLGKDFTQSEIATFLAAGENEERLSKAEFMRLMADGGDGDELPGTPREQSTITLESCIETFREDSTSDTVSEAGEDTSSVFTLGEESSGVLLDEPTSKELSPHFFEGETGHNISSEPGSSADRSQVVAKKPLSISTNYGPKGEVFLEARNSSVRNLEHPLKEEEEEEILLDVSTPNSSYSCSSPQNTNEYEKENKGHGSSQAGNTFGARVTAKTKPNMFSKNMDTVAGSGDHEADGEFQEAAVGKVMCAAANEDMKDEVFVEARRSSFDRAATSQT